MEVTKWTKRNQGRCQAAARKGEVIEPRNGIRWDLAAGFKKLSGEIGTSDIGQEHRPPRGLRTRRNIGGSSVNVGYLTRPLRRENR
jgi:hypothetical protein